ncbi:MAG: transposase [Roseiflexaceae bacterium]
MSYDPDRHHRHSTRLRDYDYAQAGVYFLTLCTEGHAQPFGRIANGVVVLTEIGGTVAEEWERTPIVRPNIELDAFIVMPDHLHGIIVIAHRNDESPVATPTGLRSPAQTVGAIVRGFKAAVVRRVGTPIWLRNYYEHIIRSDADLDRIRQYIATNPVRWEERR